MNDRNIKELDIKKLSRQCRKAKTPEEMQAVMEKVAGGAFPCFCVALEQNGNYRLVCAALLAGDDYLSAAAMAGKLQEYDKGEYKPQDTTLTPAQLTALVDYGHGFLFMLDRSENVVHIGYLPMDQEKTAKKQRVAMTLLEVL